MKFLSYKYIGLLLLLVGGTLAQAQTGEYAVRAVQYDIDEVTMKYYIDLEIQAANLTDSFHLADANFVLNFDETVVNNPVIETELVLSGLATSSGSFSFYDPHTLNGSIDSFLVYNLSLVGGPGYPLTNSAWTGIGRVAFDILDLGGSPKLSWRSTAEDPPTVVLERFDDLYYPIMNGTSTDLELFVAPTCSIVDCVWPGDTDNSYLVDNQDVLNIGIAYGATGPKRINATLDWEGQGAYDWNLSTPASNLDYKHIDADGNGVIDLQDTLAISLNWGEYYNPVQLVANEGDVPFYLVPPTVVNPDSTIFIPVMLGDVDNPVADAYGLAFSIDYDPQVVTASTAKLIMEDSWLGTEGEDLFQLQRDFENDSRLDIGISRFDGMPISGFGQIGVLQITIKDDVLSNLTEEDFFFNINNIRLQRITEEEIPTLPLVSKITITDEILHVDELELSSFDIFPNPASDRIQISLSDPTIESLEISNVLGQTLFSSRALEANMQVETAEWPAGVYTVTVKKGKEQHAEKLVVFH